MRAREKKNTQPNNNCGANLGFEQKLWQAADKLRGHMDAAEYKHVVLGLIFLKYISDAFQERYEALKKEPHADPEDRDEYTAENVFWVPKQARWAHLQAHAKQATIGKLIDDAMEEIEKANPSLKGVLPRDYNRPSLDKHRLGELIDLIADIGLGVEADLVDCVIALPGQLFYVTQIPACLWFLERNKSNGKFRDRRRQTLFIDAREMGYLVDRVHREFSDQDIVRIAGTYHAWRGEKDAGEYKDVAGFCKSVKADEIAAHAFILTPGGYVGTEQQEGDGEHKMKRLTATLREQFQESAKLQNAIEANLKSLGFGI